MQGKPQKIDGRNKTFSHAIETMAVGHDVLLFVFVQVLSKFSAIKVILSLPPRHAVSALRLITQLGVKSCHRRLCFRLCLARSLDLLVNDLAFVSVCGRVLHLLLWL